MQRTKRRPEVISAHNLVADIYLLGLAALRAGKLATLDQHLPVSNVAKGNDAFAVLPDQFDRGSLFVAIARS